ncbi:MAG: biotin/lipoyl-binding protein, partial [Bacteroidia bacterium]
MGKNVKIKRGMDITLEGQPENTIHSVQAPATFALKPKDFKGLIPKLNVKQGDEVKAGDCLFTDKGNSSICFTSPVSGEVAEIVRGDRRAIMEVKILADSEVSYKSFATSGYAGKSRDEVKALLLEAGLWPFIVQRPFGVIADTDISPKAIHVSGFDSAPLAADLSVSLKGEEANLKVGFEVLQMLTDGKVHLNLHANKNADIYSQVTGVEVNTFSGPHPSGLVGLQINKVDPINKG